MTETTKRVRAPYARSPRNKKPGTNPGVSAALKLKWQDPVYRARMKERDENRSRLMREHPERFFRRGVPNGMRKRDAAPLWERANELADRFIKIMKDNGQLPVLADEQTIVKNEKTGEMVAVNVPSSDAAKAEVALREVFVLAVGPSTQQIKIQAINTVLAYTKSKPEAKAKLTLNKAEDFLAAVAADMQSDDGAE